MTTRDEVTALLTEAAQSQTDIFPATNPTTFALILSCKEVIATHPKEAARWLEGGTAMGFLVGQVMRKTSGQANPKLTQTILEGILLYPDLFGA